MFANLTIFNFVLCQIKKARVICECLIAAEGVDLKLEALCLFLLGQVFLYCILYLVYLSFPQKNLSMSGCLQGTEAEAIETLKQLELNSDSASQKLASFLEGKDGSGKNVSLVSLPLDIKYICWSFF